MNKLAACCAEMPLFAVLRGVRADEAADVARTLYDAGVRIIEVTLNSPDPFASIEAIANCALQGALIGAGTVIAPEDVARVKSAGGEVIISPNTDAAVIAETKKRDLLSLPGFFTPSEAFAALQAGADGLKFFPAELAAPAAVRAIRAVLPREAKLFVVGGVNADNMSDYVKAGADGFGAGSNLFKPGKSLSDIARDARALTGNLRAALKG